MECAWELDTPLYELLIISRVCDTLDNIHNHILVSYMWLQLWLQPSYTEIASFTKMTVATLSDLLLLLHYVC